MRSFVRGERLDARGLRAAVMAAVVVLFAGNLLWFRAPGGGDGGSRDLEWIARRCYDDGEREALLTGACRLA